MSKMAPIVEEEQYKQECGNACGCVLTFNTPIMCWNNGESELTLCNECYWDAGYWKDDQNEDNREEIQDFKMCCEEDEEEDERLTAEYEATKDYRNSVSDDLEYLKFHCDNKKQVKRIFDEDYEGQFYYDIDKDTYLKEGEENINEEDED